MLWRTSRALKVVELTAGKVTTLAETPLGLRHGPHVERRRPDGVCCLSLERSTAARIRTRPASRDRSQAPGTSAGRGHGAGDSTTLPSLADYSVSLNCAAEFPDEYRPVLDVMLGQLIGLFASMRCGLKPDQPSPSGTITRVVQPIKLYS